MATAVLLPVSEHIDLHVHTAVLYYVSGGTQIAVGYSATDPWLREYLRYIETAFYIVLVFTAATYP